MNNEHNPHFHIPRFHVAHQAFEEADTAFARENLAELDQEFPRPELREPSTQYLRTLGCPEKYIPLIKQLNTPWEIQAYIDQHFKYDHSNATRGFVGILETKENSAHCFEGAMFAYTLLWLHGWKPGIVLLQAGDNKYGEDHNIVPYRYGNRLGAIAMSAWETLKGKPPVYPSLRDLVLGGYYFPFTSELEPYQGVWNLVGYSDKIDLVEKFGTDWMFRAGEKALQDIYDYYARDLMCTHLFNGSRYRYIDEKPGADSLEGGRER